MQKAKPKHYSTFIIALFICLLYSDIAKKEEKSSSALRRSNLSQEHNVTVIQEEHLKFGEEKEHIIPKRESKAQKDIKYTAFCSSHTWGAALDNRDEDTYVKQLARPYFDYKDQHNLLIFFFFWKISYLESRSHARIYLLSANQHQLRRKRQLWYQD